MINEAEKNAAKDKLWKDKVEARNYLDSYLYDIKSAINNPDIL